MAPNPRALNAFRAMQALGIPRERVDPVLRKLFRLYDKKWELIEEDNYRTLADAIFEYADDQMKEERNKNSLEYDESERPFKKPHLVQAEDQVSSTMNHGIIIIAEDETRQKTPTSQKFMESSESYSREPRNEPGSHYIQTPSSSNKGKDPISSEFAHKKPKAKSSAFRSNTAVNRTSSGHVKREYVLEDFHDGEEIMQNVDDLAPYHGPLEGSTGNHSFNLISHNAAVKDTSYGENIDIASSPLGEVKISLNFNSSFGKPSFSPPRLDSVLKSLEDKYLRSYQIVSPQFSVVKLLKDLCESYLKLGINGDCKRDFDIKDSHGPGTSKLPICDKKKAVRKISDITKGTENVQISLLDEIGNEHLPNFVYIQTNTIYQNAFVHVSLARIPDEDCCSSCIGDCLSSSVPCECARDTGGEFAYTPDGLLKEEFLKACISMNQEPQKHHNIVCKDCPLERAKNMSSPEPCKGHLVRKFIKECWRKCGCNMQCGNRVVQRGISCKLQVFLTKEGKGWGLRALEELPKGTFICEYVGEILTNMELYDRNKQSSGSERHTYPVLLDADWCSEGILKDEEALCLDATYYGNVARFINHRCFDANLLEVPVEVEATDHHYYHLAFFTKRKVGAFEELTWDYGIDFDDHDHPIKAFQCCCASALCRDKKRRGTKASVSTMGRAMAGGGTTEQLSS